MPRSKLLYKGDVQAKLISFDEGSSYTKRRISSQLEHNDNSILTPKATRIVPITNFENRSSNGVSSKEVGTKDNGNSAL